MRMPNPRVFVPVLLAAIAGGAVGFVVTATSCGPGSCTGSAIAIAVVVALGAAVGVGVVVVLAMRSFAEWGEQVDRDVLVADDREEPT